MHVLQLQQLFLPLWVAVYLFIITEFKSLVFLADTAPSCGLVSCTGQYINWLGFITIPFLALTAFILIAGASFYVMKAVKAAK